MKKLSLYICFILISKAVLGQLSAGPNLVICEGESTFLGGSGGSNYRWSSIPYDPSLTTPSIPNPEVSPTVTTTYILESRDVGNNFLLNGSFELGNIDFTSDYTYSPGSIYNEGTYAIVADANTVHPNFFCDEDHTTGSGEMMCVNGSSQSNVVVWSTNLANVTPDTEYEFSTWITSLHATSPAILQFKINGVLLGTPFHASAITCQWFQFFEVWDSGSATSAEISIVNQNTAGSGNDFALDDISYAKVTFSHDTCIVYVVPEPTSDYQAPDTLCFGEEATIVYTGNAPDTATFNWNFDGGLILSGSGPGPYQVQWDTPGIRQTSLTVQHSCESPETLKQIEVFENPTIGLSANDLSIPYGTKTTLHAVIDGQPGPLEYVWSPATLLDDPPNILNPITSNLEYSTTYYFNLSDQTSQCASIDSIFIEVTGSPLNIASLVATPDTICDGESTVIQANVVGGSGDYLLKWTSFPDVFNHEGTEVQVTIFPTENTTYFVTVDDGFNQSGPSEAQVVVLPQPVLLQSPVDIQVNNGETASFSVAVTNATSYQWQYSADAGANWIDITDNGIFSGSQTAVLNIDPANGNMDQWQFRCLAQGACDLVYSESALLTVIVSLDIITNLLTDDACEGELLSVTCRITNFIEVVDMSLAIQFDETALEFIDIADIASPIMDGFLTNINGGVISLDWQSGIPADVADGLLFKLEFQALTPGTSQLEWIDESCNIVNVYALSPSMILEGNNQQILPLPLKADYAFAEPDTLVITEETSIELTAEGGSGEALQWSMNDCNDPVIGEGNPISIFRPEETTSYFARWETSCGESECVEVTVVITTDFGLFLPSAFSPNNDGLNDRFLAVSQNDLFAFSMQIFNRWGQLVFESDDLYEGWDGKQNDQAVPLGTYIWKVTYQFRREGIGSELHNQPGIVVVLK